jgi:hypothetical protein
LYDTYSNVLAAKNVGQTHVAEYAWNQKLKDKDLWIIDDKKTVKESTAKVLYYIFFLPFIERF